MIGAAIAMHRNEHLRLAAAMLVAALAGLDTRLSPSSRS